MSLAKSVLAPARGLAASAAAAAASRRPSAASAALRCRPARSLPLTFARGYKSRMHLQQEDEFGEEESDQEFILNILAASPSTRDSRSYMASFHPPTPEPAITLEAELPTAAPPAAVAAAEPDNQLVTQLLNPIVQRPALVKIQGPFSDHQLASIARGIHYLQKLGLVSVVVIDRDDIPPFEAENAAAAEAQRTLVLRDVERVVHYLTKARAPARPILATVARLSEEGDVYVEAEGLDHVRRAVEDGEIPVLMPVALDQGCRSRRISANGVLCALAEAMSTCSEGSVPITAAPPGGRLDLTPVRLLIINREGGIPSYARYGLPHLSINLSSEFDYINRTFQPNWRQSHPTALSNLALADECLSHMPRTSSALIVSHRSPAALIANLITNKPAHSSSLPHALLEQSEGRITPDTPTLIRRGMPVRILRKMEDIDKAKLTTLMERSFNRVLNQDAYWARLEKDLDFVIVIGDYAAAAVVTHEGRDEGQDICYLDKFAVLPSHQGDGTVDFLWVALRDETYGLGLQDAANPSVGSLSGVGRGRDLVWRSRANNPVNKWYFERSNGFVICGTNKMFWCDAEQRMREIAQETGGLMRVVDPSESDRIAKWAPVIENIKSAWSD